MISKSVDQLMDEILANLRQMFDNNEHAEVANAIVTAQTLATSLFYLTANGPITITTGSKKPDRNLAADRRYLSRKIVKRNT